MGASCIARTGKWRSAQRAVAQIQGISQKMLTQTIRRLEINGLVARHDFKTIPPKVEYSLTEFGKSFNNVLITLDDWLDEHIPDLMALPA